MLLYGAILANAVRIVLLRKSQLYIAQCGLHDYNEGDLADASPHPTAHDASWLYISASFVYTQFTVASVCGLVLKSCIDLLLDVKPIYLLDGCHWVYIIMAIWKLENNTVHHMYIIVLPWKISWPRCHTPFVLKADRMCNGTRLFLIALLFIILILSMFLQSLTRVTTGM